MDCRAFPIAQECAGWAAVFYLQRSSGSRAHGGIEQSEVRRFLSVAVMPCYEGSRLGGLIVDLFFLSHPVCAGLDVFGRGRHPLAPAHAAEHRSPDNSVREHRDPIKSPRSRSIKIDR